MIMKTRQQIVIIEGGEGSEELGGINLTYLRLAEVELLLSRGRQPPMMKPRATALARTNPHGRSIDVQNKNFRLTRLAFWTDNSAIRAIQAAAIVEIIKFVIALAFPNYDRERLFSPTQTSIHLL